MQDDFKQEIILQEAVTNKLIRADAMSNKKAKIISLTKTFPEFFPKKSKVQTAEEQARIFRRLMKSEKNLW